MHGSQLYMGGNAARHIRKKANSHEYLDPALPEASRSFLSSDSEKIIFWPCIEWGTHAPTWSPNPSCCDSPTQDLVRTVLCRQ